MKLLALNIFSVVAAFVTISFAQDYPLHPPAGGGEFNPNPNNLPCISAEEHQQIETILQERKKELKDKGFPKASQPLSAPLFDWPLRQASGRKLDANYTISNFIDHDSRYPGELLDYTGGRRTYDTPSGYNHRGTDIILWPFAWQMMDNMDAEIVAAADGVILYKSDGNFDRNCSFNSGQWNAVYVQHADGSVTWYGHMKKGTLTSKPLGASVSQGEFLGNVGSSGSSTIPHLHFEAYDANNKVIDPWEGPMNPSISTSWWVNQKPYIDPQINTLLTHSAPPDFGTCPDAEVTNTQDVFPPGSTIYFVTYYHDQTNMLSTNYRIRRPDNSVYHSWKHTTTEPYYIASYWYWYYTIPLNEPLGTWKFEADFKGKTYSHDFVIAEPNGVDQSRMTDVQVSNYPNPVSNSVTFEYSLPQRNIVNLTIFDVMGRETTRVIPNVMKEAGSYTADFDASHLASGSYIYILSSGSKRVMGTMTVLR